ncbi:fumarylacetoacetate hydrolase family protein [Microaerobacter geothermalis]|uniref:fumarylacetoacetate hydrolase family protein n=1 Tax=Microaerobacter geothermalis TaxID=674972 RepID=UPI001F3949D8|nr:fumarylacetoacetate hydrolase family protein [Microaerobacter geothermalis]MCF6092661.1 fumarylacetoacetate hydrolase family protein [Microaerobacter geothermalis]
MFFVTFSHQGRDRVGILNTQKDKVLDLLAAQSDLAERGKLSKVDGLYVDMISSIRFGELFIEQTKKVLQLLDEEHFHSPRWLLMEDIQLKAPIPRPLKNIFCLGKNYADHAIEMGGVESIPKDPMVFSKAPTTVIGPNEGILSHHKVTSELDYEGELALVIGKKGRGISKEDAWDYVFGYTIINDVTARDLQQRHKQFLIGKSLDTSCPMGPYLVYREAISNPSQLKIETRVNGEIRQSSSTDQFIFNIPTIIETLSAGMTLEPGDIIATGTPSGVGKGFHPPKFLQPGDVIEIAIEGIGVLRNQVIEDV